MNEIQRSISSIIKGYTIYLITSIATVIICCIMLIPMIVAAVAAGMDSNFVPTQFDLFAMFSGMMIYLLIFLVAAVVTIYGMYVTYTGLKKLSTQLDTAGNEATNKLSIAMLITMISSIVAFVPVIGGFLTLAGGITAIVFNFMGYSELRKSVSLNEAGKEATKKLFQSIVFYLIMIGCCITIIGIIAVPVFFVLYWVYLFNGWIKLRDAMATTGCEIPRELSENHQ